MALWQGRSKRKGTGGMRRFARKKRKFEIGSEKQYTYVGEQKTKLYRTRGRNQKARLMNANIINVFNPKTGETEKVEVLTVKTNPANPHYVQRNIMTKGATVQTELGVAKITSRPGQDGVLNGILIEES